MFSSEVQKSLEQIYESLEPKYPLFEYMIRRFAQMRISDRSQHQPIQAEATPEAIPVEASRWIVPYSPSAIHAPSSIRLYVGSSPIAAMNSFACLYVSIRVSRSSARDARMLKMPVMIQVRNIRFRCKIIKKTMAAPA